MTIKVIKGKRNNTYKSVCMVNGKRVNRTFKTRTDAKIHEAKLLTDADYSHRLTSDVRLTLDKVINDYCDWYNGIDLDKNGKPIRSKKTGKIITNEPRGRDWVSMKHRVGRWSADLGHKAIGKITSDDVHDFLMELKSEEKAPSTVNRYKSSLSSVFNYAIEERKMLKKNPCHEVKYQKESKGIDRHLKDKEITALLAVCKQSDWGRLYLLVLMAITTGARRSELLGLTWDKINFNARSAYLAMTKNGTSRTLALTVGVIDELQQFREVGTGFVFPSECSLGKAYTYIDWVWQAALKAADINNFRFHDLRHTAASRLAANGVMMKEIGDILGHKSIASTARYIHFSTSHKHETIDKFMSGIK